MDFIDVVGGERRWILVGTADQSRDFFLALLEISTVDVRGTKHERRYESGEKRG